MITFGYPALLLIGAAALFLFARLAGRRGPWRWGAALGLAFAVAYPVISWRNDRLHVVALADISKSMPTDARLRQGEMLGLLADNLAAGDQLSVISFGAEPWLEGSYRAGDRPGALINPASRDASNVHDAVRLGLEISGSDASASLLVLSDGDATGLDPLAAAARAAARGIPVHHRHLGRAAFFDLAIREVRGPLKIVANEPFALEFDVFASAASQAEYRIFRGDAPIGQAQGDGGWRTVSLRQGINIVSIPDILRDAGVVPYTMEVRSAPNGSESAGEVEQITENNRAEHYVRVLGEDRVLVVNGDGQPDNVARLLSSAGLPVAVTSVGSYRFEIIRLLGYKAVVLNGVPISGLNSQQVRDLANFVVEEGGGLIVTGGPKSFQAGGFYNTALEPILPVSLDIQRRDRRVATAMSFVLDRSGSMSVPVASGIAKMDLANRGTAAGIELLSDYDSVSVIAVDSSPHVIVKQAAATNRRDIASRVLRIRSEGGGIFTYTGLLAAGQELTKSPLKNKHIVLFADAADAEEPGDYKVLLADYTAAGISVSVIGLGTDRDVDAEFLRDVARRGGGDSYFTTDPHQLPQLFTLDTMNRTRRAFIADPAAPWRVMPAARALSQQAPWHDFAAADYNILSPRPEADTVLLSADEDQAAGLAYWQRGLGRVVAIAFDTGGAAAAEPFFGPMMVDATRWAMGSEVEDSFMLTTRRQGQQALVEVELSDDQARRLTRAELTVRKPDGHAEQRPLRWRDSNTLEAAFTLDQSGPYRGVVDLGGELLRLDPMTLPGSPEFRLDRAPDEGRRLLGEMSRQSGGQEVIDVRALFDRRGQVAGRLPLAPYLLSLVLCFLLLEIADQRFAITARGIRYLSGWRQQWVPLVRSLARRKPLAPGTFGRDAKKPPLPEAPAPARFNLPKRQPRRTVSRRQDEEAIPEALPTQPPKQTSTAPEAPGDMGYLRQTKLRGTKKPGDPKR